MSAINFTLDGKEYLAEEGIYIVDAAKDNDVYIPTLCNIPGVKPRGACRICTVKVNGRFMAACSTPLSRGMEIINNSAEITDIRKSIIEILFVEGNHFCPSCEKSGNCELQALAYRFGMTVPRFPYQFKVKKVDGSHPKIIKDHNRCILCKRCIRVIKDSEDRNIFAYKKRGTHLEINIDPELSLKLTDDLAKKAIDICPVGAILGRENAFREPIGSRQYDKNMIGDKIFK